MVLYYREVSLHSRGVQAFKHQAGPRGAWQHVWDGMRCHPSKFELDSSSLVPSCKGQAIQLHMPHTHAPPQNTHFTRTRPKPSKGHGRPPNIPGATPQLSFISAKKVLYGYQKKVAADREADTFDTHHHQTCPGWVLMHFGPLSKVLGHPQNVTPSWVWQLLHEHTWPVTWSEHWLGNGLVAHGGSPDLVTLPPSLYSRIV